MTLDERIGVVIPFSTIDFAQRFNWPLQTFTLPNEQKIGMQMGRAIIRVKKLCSPGVCRVYVTTDAHVQVLSQEEMETGVLCKDKPLKRRQKRKTVERTLSVKRPTLWIGLGQIAVDYTGHEGENASFCFRTNKSMPIRATYSEGNYEAYSV